LRTSAVARRSVKASSLRSGASCFPGYMSAIGRLWALVPWLPGMSRQPRRSSVYRHGRFLPEPGLNRWLEPGKPGFAIWTHFLLRTTLPSGDVTLWPPLLRLNNR